MRLHRRTVELFGPVTLDDAPPALPASVAEWHGVSETSELWRWYAGSDDPAIRRRAGWWEVPPTCEDVSGLIRAAVQPVVYETQGCCWWGVPLDGTDDPPVVVCLGDRGDRWDYYASSYSDFVLARVFDLSMLYRDGAKRTVHVDREVDGDGLRNLRRLLRAEATTREGGDSLAHRFSADGQRLRLGVVRRDTRTTGYATWQLWAADAGRFAALVETLSGVCGLLHGVTPDAQSPLHLRGEVAAFEPPGDDLPF